MPDLLEEAKRLSEAATPGPWEWVGSTLEAGHYAAPDVLEVRDMPEHAYPEMQSGELVINDADRAFIARARTLIPELVERVEQAERIEEAALKLAACPACRSRLLDGQEFNAHLTHLDAALAAQQREVEGDGAAGGDAGA